MDVVLAQRDVDDLGAGRRQIGDLPVHPVRRRERLLDVVYVEGQDHVRLLEQLRCRVRQVQWVPAGEVEEVTPRDDGQRQRLGQPHEAFDRFRRLAEVVGDHHRALGAQQEVRGLLEQPCVCLRTARLWEGRGVRDRQLLVKRHLLEGRVEADVNGTLGLRYRDLVRADQGVDEAGDARRLVVPLYVVAHSIALYQSRVDPIDPRPPLLDGHGTGPTENDESRMLEPRVEDGVGAVQQPDDVVDRGCHGLAGSPAIAVCDGDGDALVGAQDRVRVGIASVVHE